MDEARHLVDSLYSRFLLRDVLAKAVPGGFVLVAMLIEFVPDGRLYLDNVFAYALVLTVPLAYGMAFGTGMLLQFLADQLRIIKITVSEGRRRDLVLDLRNYMNALDNGSEVEKQILERTVVLKEMMGSWAVVLTVISLAALSKYAVQGYAETLFAVAFAVIVVVRVWAGRRFDRPLGLWQAMDSWALASVIGVVALLFWYTVQGQAPSYLAVAFALGMFCVWANCYYDSQQRIVQRLIRDKPQPPQGGL